MLDAADPSPAMAGSPRSGYSRGTTGQRLLSRILKLPGGPQRFRVEEAHVPMRDGVTLVADHYVPHSPNGGTVLVRTPYVRSGLTPLLYALPFVTHGYHVVIQSCRGTFGSQGVFTPGVHEMADGHDTTEWLRQQPWYGGKFATIGGSYVAFTQWAILQDPPEDLAAAVCWIGPHDLSRLVWTEGAFRLADMVTWCEQVAHQEHVGPVVDMYRLLTSSRRHQPVYDSTDVESAAEPLLEGRAPWFGQWVNRPDLSDQFWDGFRAEAGLHTGNVPLLLAGGWQDIMMEQGFEQYRARLERGCPIALTVGPWSHAPSAAVRAAGSWCTEALEWFSEHLSPTEVQPRDRSVRVSMRGRSESHSLDRWPPPANQRRFVFGARGQLTSDGATMPVSTTHFTFDPADPTPAAGGPFLARGGGYQDGRKIERRDDVLTFTTAVLREPLTIAGGGHVTLRHECLAESGDLHVTVSDVDASGRSVGVTDAFARIPASVEFAGTEDDIAFGRQTLSLRDTAHTFAAGHRIRVRVAGGAHPFIARNPGTGQSWSSSGDFRKQRHVITLGGASPSFLSLPVADGFLDAGRDSGRRRFRATCW